MSNPTNTQSTADANNPLVGQLTREGRYISDDRGIVAEAFYPGLYSTREKVSEISAFLVEAVNAHARLTRQAEAAKGLSVHLAWTLQFAERFSEERNKGVTMLSCLAQARAALAAYEEACK